MGQGLNTHIFAQVFDDAITQKWKTEVIQSPGADFTPEMADYCIEELKYKANLYKKTGFTKVHTGDVVKSDTAIPADLQAALKAAIALLEDVPRKEQDWHPGSDEKVLDLVHPSLFPLVYGSSRILTDTTVGIEDCIAFCGRGEVIPEPPENQALIKEYHPTRHVYSGTFQWLPCDVDISGDTPR